jgi:hypothetical protein
VKFIVFAIRWIANNLTVPFWMLGHVHLSLNLYDDLIEILASFGMNILVAIGFYLDWREHKQNK